MRRSKIWALEKEELQSIIDNSNCLGNILENLGFQSKTGDNRKTLKERIFVDNLDMSKMEERKKSTKFLPTPKNKKTNGELFTEHNTTYRSTIRKRIINENLIEYKCSICLNGGTHMEMELSLHLDHINGINDDNRLENLRFLCPNCHSQTDTYAGKRLKGRKINGNYYNGRIHDLDS